MNFVNIDDLCKYCHVNDAKLSCSDSIKLMKAGMSRRPTNSTECKCSSQLELEDTPLVHIQNQKPNSAELFQLSNCRGESNRQDSLDHLGDVLKDSLTDNKSSKMTENTADYQVIVDRLQRLSTSCDGYGSIHIPVPSNGVATVNGCTKTPPATPTCEIELKEQQKPDLVVFTDEFGTQYIRYKDETQMPDIMTLISRDLSEPYSIYTYRYFIHNWPNLCFLAMDQDKTIGAVVCKLDPHKRTLRSRGYIGMLAVDHTYRRRKIGSRLVRIAIEAMLSCNADEIVLETEVTNEAALNLYEKLGFVRDKRLHRYYLNGVDAIRLKLWIT